MPYRSVDLPKHRFPLVWEQPPEDWLIGQRRLWKTYKERDAKQFHIDYIEFYDYEVANPDDPQGLRCCNICELAFDSPAWMLLHFRTYDHQCRKAAFLGEPKPDDPLFCKICEFRGISKRKMEYHEKSFEHIRALAIREGKPVPTNEKYCKVCDLTFMTTRGLENHMTTTKHRNNVAKLDGETAFYCKVCEKHCVTKQSLQKHLLSSKHLLKAGGKVIETACIICDRKYRNRNQYLKHCRTPAHMKKCKVVPKTLVVWA